MFIVPAYATVAMGFNFGVHRHLTGDSGETGRSFPPREPVGVLSPSSVGQCFAAPLLGHYSGLHVVFSSSMGYTVRLLWG